MKKTALAVTAILLASAAQAQWTQLGRNENLRLFVDQTAIQRNGDIAQMWQLYDYITAQWAGAQVIYSVKNLVEYDCAGKRTRILGGSAYGEHMGQGKVIASENAPNAEWSPIPAGGTAENTWSIACGKN
jgi:hypothetical protein